MASGVINAEQSALAEAGIPSDSESVQESAVWQLNGGIELMLGLVPCGVLVPTVGD